MNLRRRDRFFRSPRWIVRKLAERNPEVLFYVETEEKRIALTIDDAPHSLVTPEILNVLSEFEARATFFVIGSHAKANLSLVQDIVDAGHELGNHLYTDRPSLRLPSSEFVSELRETHRLLQPFGPLRWCRPGSGALNQRMVDAMKEEGYRPCLASDYPVDTHLTADIARRQFLANVAPGAILVLHDGYEGRRKTAQILASCLPWVRDQGYEVVTVSELVDGTEEAQSEADSSS